MKKLVSMLLVVAMVLSLGVVSFAADKTYADYLAEAKQVVNDLGIMVGEGDGDIKPDTLLTREEMFVIMYSINERGGKMSDAETKKYNAYANVLTSIIPDINDCSAWARPYAAYVYQKGIFVGGDNGKLYPKNNLSVAECTVLMLRSLGYTDAQIHAGCNHDKGVCNWKTNTIMLGIGIDLYENLASTDYGKAINRGDISIMIKNMFGANIFDGEVNGLKNYFGQTEFKNLYTTVIFAGANALAEDADGHKKGDTFFLAMNDDQNGLNENKYFLKDYGFTGAELYREYTWIEVEGKVTCTPREVTKDWTELSGKYSTLGVSVTSSVKDGVKKGEDTPVKGYISLGGASVQIASAPFNEAFNTSDLWIFWDKAYEPAINADENLLTYKGEQYKETLDNEALTGILKPNDFDSLTLRVKGDLIIAVTDDTYFDYLKAVKNDKKEITGYETVVKAEADGFFAYKYDRTGEIDLASVVEIKPTSVHGYKITGSKTYNISKAVYEYTMKYDGKAIDFAEYTRKWVYGTDEQVMCAELFDNYMVPALASGASTYQAVYLYNGVIVNYDTISLSTAPAESTNRPFLVTGISSGIDANGANITYTGIYLDTLTAETVKFAADKVIIGANGGDYDLLAVDSTTDTDLFGKIVIFIEEDDIDSEKDGKQAGTAIYDGVSEFNPESCGFVTQYIGSGDYANKIWLDDDAAKTIGAGKDLESVAPILGETSIKVVVDGVTDDKDLQGYITKVISEKTYCYVIPQAILNLILSNYES